MHQERNTLYICACHDFTEECIYTCFSACSLLSGWAHLLVLSWSQAERKARRPATAREPWCHVEQKTSLQSVTQLGGCASWGGRNAIGKTLNDDKVCILHTGALGQSGKSKFSRGWNGKISYQEMSVGLHQQCSVFQWQLTHVCVYKCVFLCFAVLFLEFTQCLKICLTSKQCYCDTAAASRDVVS